MQRAYMCTGGEWRGDIISYWIRFWHLAWKTALPQTAHMVLVKLTIHYPPDLSLDASISANKLVSMLKNISVYLHALKRQAHLKLHPGNTAFQGCSKKYCTVVEVALLNINQNAKKPQFIQEAFKSQWWLFVVFINVINRKLIYCCSNTESSHYGQI